MRIKFFLSIISLLTMIVFSSSVSAKTCSYYLGYITGEAERAYAVKKVYRYTPERLEKILSLRDKGQALCASGDDKAGMEILLESVKTDKFHEIEVGFSLKLLI